MSVDVAVWAGTVFAGLGLLGAGGAWLFRTAIKPLKIVVENNTAAWTMVVATLTKQDEIGKISRAKRTRARVSRPVNPSSA